MSNRKQRRAAHAASRGLMTGSWITLPSEKGGGTFCTYCRLQRVNKDDPDPCLGHLPGVVNACCGHGGRAPYPAYVIFQNGVKLVFDPEESVRIADGASVNFFAATQGDLECTPLTTDASEVGGEGSSRFYPVSDKP